MFVTPEEVLDYFHKYIDDRKGELGLGYVAYGDEELLPQYPAVKITAGPLQKQLHATHQWLNEFSIHVWVYHGKLGVGHAIRTKEDLELCTAIRNLMHNNMTLEGNLIQGWFTSENPGAINRPKGGAVVGTHMVWDGIGVETF